MALARDREHHGVVSPVQRSIQRDRRDSTASVASRRLPNSEALASTLDHIHNTASAANTLTTFSEYAPPPRSFSGSDTRSLAGEIVQGGISGLYSRLVASVGSSKDGETTVHTETPPKSSDSQALPSPLRLNDRANQVTGSSTGLEKSSATKKTRTSKPKELPASLADKEYDALLSVVPPSKGLQSTTTHNTNEIFAEGLFSNSASSENGHRSENYSDRAFQATRGVVQSPDKNGSGQDVEDSIRSENNLSEPAGFNDGRAAERMSELAGRPASLVDTTILNEADSTPTILFERPTSQRLISRSLNIPTTDVVSTSGVQDRSNNTSLTDIDTPQRPPLLHISPSHLPGYRPSRTTSSDANLSLTTIDALPRHESSSVPVEAQWARQELAKASEASSPHLGSRLLAKEFWMRDENAKDCFYCGDTFSTFRRKHHCRTCGQIFDAKCTCIISGKIFGIGGSVRVCKSCENIINGNEDDSSAYSEASEEEYDGNSQDVAVLAGGPDSDVGTPSIGIPVSRKAADQTKRRSAVLEFEGHHALVRPSSARSLRSLTGRPNTPHKWQHLKSNLMRTYKSSPKDRAPFQGTSDSLTKDAPLPAFHHDSIIDPDLAPFLSDDGSSDDDTVSIFATLDGEKHPLPSRLGADGPGFNALFSSVRRTKSRSDRHDTDMVSLSSKHLPRSNRRRNTSVNSTSLPFNSPRRTKSNSLLKGFPLTFGSSLVGQTEPEHSITRTRSSHSRMTRSSSMRGKAAPAIELNQASLQHVRKMLEQLLQDADVPSLKQWERALLPMLLRCTNDVNPDIRRHDFIDIRHYVKIKRISGSRPGDTSYISGVVFTKNVALKSMTRTISQPRIIIVRFAIEYARQNQHFMSLEPVIAQEKEYLRNLVRRIVAFDPQVLLVQKNVSGLALRLLADAGITVICNVKASVLNAVARCTQAKQISSVDRLVYDPAQVGHAGSFEVKTYVTNNTKKTYVWLAGCRPDLGCTIVLRGAESDVLRRLKRISEFMCYVVYNLRLETNLMRDEYAFIPSNLESGAVAQYTRPCQIDGTGSPPHSHYPKHSESWETRDETSNFSRAGANMEHPRNALPADTGESSGSLDPTGGTAESGLSDTTSTQPPSFYDDVVEKHKTKILSTSPFVRFAPPYLLMQVREQESRLARLRVLRDQYRPGEEVQETGTGKFQLIHPEMVRGVTQKLSKQVKEFLYAVHNAEYDKALFGYMTQKRQWESYLSETINLFDPFSHQRIAFLYSMVNSQSTTPCIGPEVVALEYYNEQELEGGFATDITLGQYVVDLIHGANTVCGINGCEKTLFHHHRQYVHGPGQMSVHIQKQPPKLPGLQGTILMWSQCRVCHAETPPLPMSDGTWRYSFGKYLELTFWSSELHPRAKVCPHDIHRDHLRYFGLHNAAVRIQYDSIQLHEVITPRSVITWKVESDLKLKNEQYQKLKDRLDRFMQSVKARLKSIHVEGVLPEKTDSCRTELERLLKTADEDHQVLVKKLQEKYMKSRYYEIIPFNRAVRFMHERAIWWDDTFADFERSFFPSEKDIRRLAQQQLRRLFIEKEESIQSSGFAEDDHGHLDHEKGLLITSKETVQLTPSPSRLSTEDAHSLLQTGLEEATAAGASHEGVQDLPFENSQTRRESLLLSSEDQIAKSQEVEHLDLAIRSSQGNTAVGTQISDTDPRKSTSPVLNNEVAVPSTAEIVPSSPSELAAAAQALISESKIPRPVDSGRRESTLAVPPPLSRAYSQPVELTQRQIGTINGSVVSGGKPDMQKANLRDVAKGLEKRLAERLSGTLRVSRNVSQSFIPRSIATGRRDMSRVSTLAKHFEQLTRELERERMHERRLRTARTKQAREYPLASSKPTMEVFSDAHQAVHGRTSPEEPRPDSPMIVNSTIRVNESEDSLNTHSISTTPPKQYGDDLEEISEILDENSPVQLNRSSSLSDTEGADTDDDVLDDSALLSPTESQLDTSIELPKSEKVSLMKMLRSFWSERSASGWIPLEYPLLPTEHVWDNSDVIVREDEPSSIIALALSDKDYLAKLRSFRNQPTSTLENISRVHREGTETLDSLSLEDEASVERNMLRAERTHISYSFNHRGVRARCKIFYSESFDAVRRKCGIADRFVESLSRCLKWDSKGGKTRSLFLKTMDDRFVLKSLSQPEVTAFFKFAPNYFSFMHQILFKSLPSVIAKMFGLFQVTIKNPATGIEYDWFMLVMENLFYHREPDRRFDLKGSMRNRKIQSTGERDEVLQDENLVDIIFEKPLFVREHTMTLLQACVWNDTLFLSQQNVMDYSLMAGFVDERLEIIVGIIDCIRTYTWDKKLETWIKDRGKNKPTITSPKDYKNRFRIAMSKYILLAPNCWHHFQSHIQKRPLQLDAKHNGQEAEEGDLPVQFS